MRLNDELRTLLGTDIDNPLLDLGTFMENVMTLDPHDPLNPIKKLPNYPYIRELTRLWQENPLLLVVKSRQMMISWLFIALNLQLATTKMGQFIFFVSKKESDAGYDSPLSLLSRAYFIWEHLPKEHRPYVQKTLQPPTLKIPKLRSVIQGVSQDSNALRQYTASSILCDEMAFQEHSEESYASMRPTIDKGGKFTGVSTPNGKRNLFYSLVHDFQE